MSYLFRPLAAGRTLSALTGGEVEISGKTLRMNCRDGTPTFVFPNGGVASRSRDAVREKIHRLFTQGLLVSGKADHALQFAVDLFESGGFKFERFTTGLSKEEKKRQTLLAAKLSEVQRDVEDTLNEHYKYLWKYQQLTGSSSLAPPTKRPRRKKRSGLSKWEEFEEEKNRRAAALRKIEREQNRLLAERERLTTEYEELRASAGWTHRGKSPRPGSYAIPFLCYKTKEPFIVVLRHNWRARRHEMSCLSFGITKDSLQEEHSWSSSGGLPAVSLSGLYCPSCGTSGGRNCRCTVCTKCKIHFCPRSYGPGLFRERLRCPLCRDRRGLKRPASFPIWTLRKEIPWTETQWFEPLS